MVMRTKFLDFIIPLEFDISREFKNLFPVTNKGHCSSFTTIGQALDEPWGLNF